MSRATRAECLALLASMAIDEDRWSDAANLVDEALALVDERSTRAAQDPASALLLSCWNSASSMTPLSLRSARRASSSAVLRGPAASWM
jgi:hypothetical protein